MTVPVSGGMTTTLASGQSGPGAIALDAASVYWANFGVITPHGKDVDGSVMKAPLRGGTATTLASGQIGPAGITVDDTSIYSTDINDGTVMKLTPK
jgi:hypothetical protein